jgi:hypothetical protein
MVLEKVHGEEYCEARGWNIYTGKDYLRLAKNEAEAWSKFMAKLKRNEAHGMNSIIVITEMSC